MAKKHIVIQSITIHIYILRCANENKPWVACLHKDITLHGGRIVYFLFFCFKHVKVHRGRFTNGLFFKKLSQLKGRTQGCYGSIFI